MATNAPGRLLAGRYRVERRIGSGGMGAVHLARDERLGRLVAVKRLPADSPEDAARRFEREARLGASLNHPNLVTIYDTAADEEGVLILMEYVAGSTLAAELAAGPLETGRALEVLSGVSAGLDHAHDAGVVHRDVKPANVLLGEGAVKLADLGIATAAEHSDITRTGTVLGTPSYMAPEQLEGRAIGPAVDVYALATMAFEALSGRKARVGRTPIEIASKVASEPAPDVREVWEHAPPQVAEALCRGMAHDPDDRPRSAGGLVAELRRGLESPRTAATVAAPRTTAAPRRPAPPPRAPAPAEAGAAPRAAREPTGERTLYGSRGSRTSRWAVPAVLAAAAAVLLVAVLVLALGGDDEGSSRAERSGSSTTRERRATTEPAPAPAEEPAEESPADEAPSEPVLGGGNDPEEGAELNDRGFALIQQGEYEEAVPILRRSVAAFPEGSTGHPYDFALFNLGQSLRKSGEPEEAIPYLERRLEVSDFKRGEVQAELEQARSEAGR